MFIYGFNNYHFIDFVWSQCAMLILLVETPYFGKHLVGDSLQLFLTFQNLLLSFIPFSLLLF